MFRSKGIDKLIGLLLVMKEDLCSSERGALGFGQITCLLHPPDASSVKRMVWTKA